MYAWFNGIDSRAGARAPWRVLMVLLTLAVLAGQGCSASEEPADPFQFDIVTPPPEGACEIDADCEDPEADALVGCEANACVEGFCTIVTRDDGTLCDDLDICTTDDSCLEGVCTGASRECDDGEPCTEDTCDAETEGGCVYAALEGDCDDGDACTTGDACLEGVCGGEVVDCSDLTTACSEGTCVQGVCAIIPTGDGDDCDDEDPCTDSDVCDAGSCDGTPVDCSGSDGDCGIGLCDPADGACVVSPSNDGGDCDDGDLCTETDVCSNGVCGGSALDCSALNTPCETGICDGTSGSCVGEAVANETPCDDSDACTDGDACAAGVCTSGTAVSCDDGDVCDGAETCEPATGCAEGTALECDDQDPCTDDACDASGGCTVTWNGTCACADDADCAGSDTPGLCDGTLACVDNTCVVDPDSLVPCDTSSDGACEVTSCQAATGECVSNPVADEDLLTCDDTDPCTTDDLCVAGACLGTAVDCSADDTPGSCDGTLACVDGACAVDADTIEPCDTSGDTVCATNICDGATGSCSVVNQDGDCDDGDLCTVGDACNAGQCVSGGAPDCSGLDGQCQSGTCDAATGDCIPDHFVADTSCDDASVCTDGDACDGNGACVSGSPITCDDDNPCTDDTVCDLVLGCTYPALDGTNCDDGVDCTASDVCDANGLCGGSPDHAACDNGLYCDGAETCDASAGCQDGSPEHGCGAIGGLCVEGVCEEGADGANCVVVNLEDIPCDDGDGCTYDDTCGGGACVGTDLDPCPYNDPNLLCTGYGDAGDLFYCEIRAVRACEAVPYTGTLQWYLDWDPSQVTLLGFTDRTQDPTQWPATYLYGVDPLPGYMPTAESGIFGAVPIHKYTSTTPEADGTWDGEMNIAVYTETNGLIACEAPLPQGEQCTSPIVDAYLNAVGDSTGEGLIFHAHFEIASDIPEATPAGVSFTEVIANDPLLQNFAPTLDGGVTLLDYEDSACD